MEVRGLYMTVLRGWVALTKDEELPPLLLAERRFEPEVVPPPMNTLTMFWKEGSTSCCFFIEVEVGCW
jgi:hypothetical protein